MQAARLSKVVRVAIVGSGPAGCYVAEALLRSSQNCHIDVIDRLPTPYGLVRFGVAPDHQTTKAVTRVLERVLAKPEVGFFGGVTLGRDVSIDELRALYDAVVIATGAERDRRLGIPGEDYRGVLTSGGFVGWYNHHPDRVDVELDLAAVESAVIIGNGNVALDVARVLAKSESEFTGSDLDTGVAEQIAASGVRHIHIVGRRDAAAMKFTDHEVFEFGDLARARPMLGVPEALDRASGKPAEALRDVCTRTYDGQRIEIVFHFGLTPVAFEGYERLERVRFRNAAGVQTVLKAQLAVTCIGYETRGHGLALEDGSLRNDEGRIDQGLYVSGWARRGPSGTIQTNRVEAQLLAKRIVAETRACEDSGRTGGEGLAALLQRRRAPHVDYDGWRRIDASEVARAGPARTRRKWRSLDELLAAANKR